MRLGIAIGVTALGFASAGVVAVALTPSPSVDQRAGRPCDRVASPRGRHHVAGTLAGVRRLVAVLRAGQTGCLRSGRYRHDLTITRGDIGLRSYPGERARLVGRMWIRREAHDVVISDLALDGHNPRRLPSPTVNGDRITFARVDVTNRHTAICFNVGSSRYGRAEGTVIRDSRIHACGRLPPGNRNHGIYVAAADDSRIEGNLIYDNADRGIQLYPDAQHTLITGNVIDGNGEGILFSGSGRTTSSHNLVEHNVVSNSRVRANVESFYPPGTPEGVGNVVRDNCLYGGRGGALGPSSRGFTATANRYTSLPYANPRAADYGLPAWNPCARVLQAGRSGHR